jgi:hypothetical protein
MLAGLGIAAGHVELSVPPPVSLPAGVDRLSGKPADVGRRSSELVPQGDKPLIRGKDISYDQIVDALLLSAPGKTQTQIAREMGYTPSWLSRIIANDAFQAKLAARIEEVVEPERRAAFQARFAGIEEEARGILHESLRQLSEKLDNPAGCPDTLVLKSIEVTQRLLGYGAREEPRQPPVEMHVHLESLAENLRKLNSSPSANNGRTLEHEP